MEECLYHEPAHDATLDSFRCVKTAIKLLQQSKSNDKHPYLPKARLLARKYLTHFKLQFGEADADVLTVINFLESPGCDNPTCFMVNTTITADLKSAGSAAGLKKCGRCGNKSYCCRECQVAHFKGGHKLECHPSQG